MSDFQDILDWLRGKDSWISTPYGIRIMLQHLFDTQYQSDSEFPAEKKLLYIKELFFCGLEPLMLTAMYRQECIDFGKQDLFADMGTGVLSLIKKLFTSGLPELDIHNPRLWSQSDSDSPREIQVHDAIVQTIGNDPAILGENPMTPSTSSTGPNRLRSYWRQSRPLILQRSRHCLYSRKI